MRPVLLLLLSFTAWAQKFDVASVKYTSSTKAFMARPPRVPNGVRFMYMPLQSLLCLAYQIDTWQLDWRPSSVDRARYDVDAKFEDLSQASKWPEMLQALLADRFSIKSHMEKRQTEMFTLTVDPKHADRLKPCSAQEVESAGGLFKDLNSERDQYTCAPIETIWDVVGSRLGGKYSPTHLTGSYTMVINWPRPGDQWDSEAAARNALAKYGFVVRVEKIPAKYLVVTEVGKLKPN